MQNQKSGTSLSPDYFDQVYAANSDPWSFASSEYERGKYLDTLSNLPASHYQDGFEVGCSIGVLTYQLASHCNHLLSVDVSEAALSQARQRCEGLPQVELRCMRIPEEQPDQMFDLMVVSEVAYYWTPEDLQRAMDVLAAHHRVSGHLLLVHWTPAVYDYPQTGDQVHEAWLARSEWKVLKDLQREKYRLSVLERV